MSTDKMPVFRDDVNDARRFKWIVDNPQGAGHLLYLLEMGKGTEEDFCRMIDRIEISANEAKVKK